MSVDLRALADRVEEGAGPDSVLNADVRAALDYPPKPWNYTSSLDAVEALRREKLPESRIMDVWQHDSGMWEVEMWMPTTGCDEPAEAKTEPRARLAALLRAIAGGA